MVTKKDPTMVLHPFLLGIYPLVALIGINVDQIQINEVWRSFGLVLTVISLLFVLLYLLIRDWGKVGLICTVALVLFFSWGHVFRLIEGKRIAGVLVGRADFLLATWSTVWITGTWWIIRKMSRSRARSWTRFLNVVAVLALVFPVVQIVSFSIQSARISDAATTQVFEPISLPDPLPKDRPDIYYIVVDGYGRADVLQELYDYDNSEFVEFLDKRGFFVAGQSHSNYGQTSLSLSSSLNLAYVNDFAAQLIDGSTSREPLVEVLRQSRLREVLAQAGYQFVALSSGYNVTEFVDADWYLKQGNALNAFESMWLANSAAAVVINIVHPIWYRAHLLSNLDTLADMPVTGSPRFVFAHILLPHPPFVFGPQGEPIPPKSFREGNYYDGTVEEYIQGYRGQMTFLNKRLISAIEALLDGTETEPIIVLQGDHGPGAYLNWDIMEENCFRERMSILNAYYLPDFPLDQLNDTISPVNSFRIVLDHYFQTELGLLEDRSYFSLWNSLYHLEDITDQLDTCSF
jgi:hypothetical protein